MKLIICILFLLSTSSYAEIPEEQVGNVNRSVSYAFVGLSVIVLLIYLLNAGKRDLFLDLKETFLYVLIFIITVFCFYLIFNKNGF